MRNVLLAVVIGLVAVPVALADCSFTYGWEDGGTALYIYPAFATATNVGSPDPVHGGAASLKLVDLNKDWTPDVYVCWIVGLHDGDVVTASIWGYDTTPLAFPATRIYAKYTPIGGDVTSDAGSAGGNTNYGPENGWWNYSWTWTFDSLGGTRDGLCISMRTYRYAGDTVWIDDLAVSIDSDTFCGQVYLPCGQTAVESASWTSIKALYR